MQQADDFLQESQALYALVETLSERDLAQVTAFKDWTINDVIGHLHMWNRAADMSLMDSQAFVDWFAGIQKHVSDGSLRHAEREWLQGLSGRSLLDAWRDGFQEMADHFSKADPSARVKWAGPDMSVRSSVTARLMETWAHGQEIYDALGVVRHNADRIRNIVILGINTYGWTFQVRGERIPDPMPALVLEAPSGEVWHFGDAEDGDTGQEGETITGLAEEFCQVVTQVRNIADTALVVTGKNARNWMAKAQCFAGPPEDPPAPGTRVVASSGR
jgi:uncharacterized protein (TIGR03084 family)